MANFKNPGVPEGAEIISIGRHFGGIASSPSGVSGVGKYDASVEGVQGALNKESVNQIAEADGVTLFRNSRFGHMSAAQVMTLFTDSHITDLPINGDATSKNNNSAVVVLNNGRVVEIDSSVPSYVSSYDPTGHLPISSANKNNDLIVFKDLDTTPVEYAIWTYEYSGGAEIAVRVANGLGIGGHPTDVLVADRSLGTLTPLVPHKLCTGPDLNIYCTNGNIVQQIVVNAAINAATKGQTLSIGSGYIISGICSYKNYVAIIASSKNATVSHGQTKVFLWDGQTSTVSGVTSTAANYKFEINDNYANGIHFDGVSLFAFTNGRNSTSKIWEFTNGGFKQIFESGLLSTTTTPIQGSIDDYQGGIVIGGSKNGAGVSDLFRFYGGGFHDEGLTDGTNQTQDVGMVKNLYSNELLVGVKSSTGGGTYGLLHGTNTGYIPGASLKTILFTQGLLGRRQYPLGFKGTVNRLIIYLSQWGTGASLSLGLFKDYTSAGAGIGSANDLLNLTIDTDTVTPNSINHKAYPVGTTEIDISDIAIPNLSNFYMIIKFSHGSATNTAAIIRNMVAFWSPSQ